MPPYIEAVATIIGSSVGGIIIGIAQWLVLKRYIACKGWIELSSLGWILGLTLGTLVSAALNYFGVLTTNIAYYAAIGLGVGFAQWFSLRACAPKAFVWILVNGIAIMVVGTIADRTGGSLNGMALFGPITGLALVWLRHKASVTANYQGV